MVWHELFPTHKHESRKGARQEFEKLSKKAVILVSKKAVILVSSSKQQIAPLSAPLKKTLGKIH